MPRAVTIAAKRSDDGSAALEYADVRRVGG
jgi:hypothetical protein